MKSLIERLRAVAESKLTKMDQASCYETEAADRIQELESKLHDAENHARLMEASDLEKYKRQKELEDRLAAETMRADLACDASEYRRVIAGLQSRLYERELMIHELVSYFEVLDLKYEGEQIPLRDEWPTDWLRRAKPIKPRVVERQSTNPPDWYDGNHTRCGRCSGVVSLGHVCSEAEIAIGDSIRRFMPPSE